MQLIVQLEIVFKFLKIVPFRLTIIRSPEIHLYLILKPYARKESDDLVFFLHVVEDRSLSLSLIGCFYVFEEIHNIVSFAKVIQYVIIVCFIS